MKLSTRGRYAVTAVMDLAMHKGDEPVSLAEISTCQGISLSYLEQLFAMLRKHGLVTGTRGPGGGYRLARPSTQITVADIIRAVDESCDATRCGGRENCRHGQRCLTHELWSELSAEILGFLQGITVADFVARQSVQAITAPRAKNG